MTKESGWICSEQIVLWRSHQQGREEQKGHRMQDEKSSLAYKN